MISRYGLYLAWLIATLATLASLYYSEVLKFIPCNLCWYQRIAIYPLVIILGRASYKRDKQIIPYARALAFVGLLFATYHVLEIYIPGFSGIDLCGLGANCREGFINYFGFLNIPLMSALSFIAILYLLYKAKKASY